MFAAQIVKVEASVEKRSNRDKNHLIRSFVRRLIR